MKKKNLKNTSDIDIWQAIKLNDESAFNVLFDRYFFSLCTFSFSITKQVELAEEAVSDVFINLWLKRDEIEINTNLRSYIFRAVRNTSLNYIRQQTSHIDLEMLDDHHYISNHRADSELNLQDTNKEVEQLLSALTPQQSMIFRLSRIEGFSTDEIADILSISLKTVQNHVSEAVKRLGLNHQRKWIDLALYYVIINYTIL